MILNGVNNETRIKVSGRQREWSFRNCIPSIQEHQPNGLIDKIIDQR